MRIVFQNFGQDGFPPHNTSYVHFHANGQCRDQVHHKGVFGCCMGSSLKRFLHIKRCFENLSSGEKRAGCAEMVGLLSGVSFCEVQSLNDERMGREVAGEGICAFAVVRAP